MAFIPQARRSTRQRNLSANLDEPFGLLLGDALFDLLNNRLVHMALRPRSLAAISVIFIAIGIFDFDLLIDALLGVSFATVIWIILYLCWYDRFILRNSQNQTLCPVCTSRMWQFCCARCHEPVPALIFWLHGLFLAHCPHCGLRLFSRQNSAHKDTLLGWCSTCATEFEQPRTLYGKPTNVIVWLTNARLPTAGMIGGHWRLMQCEIPNFIKLYDNHDKHSASLMYICADPRSIVLDFDEHLNKRTRLVLISTDLHPLITDIKHVFSDRKTIFRMVDPVESWQKPQE
jgi:hypothetical protein